MKSQFVDNYFLELPLERSSNWVSHMMAPVLLQHENHLEVFFGGRDISGISRIKSLNLDIKTKSFTKSRETEILDIGRPGTFDENGVFPASITRIENEVFLFYTGFQLGHKIPHFNFGGLAKINEPNKGALRVSQAPFADRQDEGLYVRAGNTYLNYDGIKYNAYSAGSSFEMIEGKLRPNYDIYLQTVNSIYDFDKAGKKIISYDPLVEHGLGRPQLLSYKDNLLLLYTIRTRNFPYKMGIAIFDKNKSKFERCDYLFQDLLGCSEEFSQMTYFPSAISNNENLILVYNGNDYGRNGLGVAILDINF